MRIVRTIVLFGALAGVALAGEMTREELLEAIQEIALSNARVSSRTPEAHEKMRELTSEFLDRFPDDDAAWTIRFRLGGALVALGRDEEGLRELVALTSTARGILAPTVDYYIAQTRMRLGEPEDARASLTAALKAPQQPPWLDGKARKDLADLDWIGKPAPIPVTSPAQPFTHTATKFDDPFKPGATPRTYVIDAHGVVRAVGVRGAAVAKALEAARCACHPSR